VDDLKLVTVWRRSLDRDGDANHILALKRLGDAVLLFMFVLPAADKHE